MRGGAGGRNRTKTKSLPLVRGALITYYYFLYIHYIFDYFINLPDLGEL